MLAEERRQKILELIYRNGQVSGSELCELFGVSDETVRRDLAAVAMAHPIKKVHGGAVLITQRNRDLPYERRRARNREQKRLIGIAAARHIADHDVIVLDSGTGAEAIAEAISGVSDIRIIVAALPVAQILLRKRANGDFSGRIYFVGGELHSSCENASGGLAAQGLRQFQADKVFVGVTAVSENGISVWDEDDGVYSTALIDCATEVIVYAESDKLGKESFYRVCPLETLSCLITDGETEMQTGLRKALEDAGVRVEFAAKHG